QTLALDLGLATTLLLLALSFLELSTRASLFTEPLFDGAIAAGGQNPAHRCDLLVVDLGLGSPCLRSHDGLLSHRRLAMSMMLTPRSAQSCTISTSWSS